MTRLRSFRRGDFERFTTVFIKTCLRDLERVRYTIEALHRRDVRIIVAAEEDFWHAYDGAWVGMSVPVESMWPESMELSPYLRQQYVKTVAPIAFGDLFIIDSDMCPRPDHPPPSSQWYYADPPPKHLEVAVHAWQETFRRYVGYEPTPGEFMRQQLGWHVPKVLAKGFVNHVEAYNKTSLVNVMQRCAAAKLKWSEFYLLGAFGYLTHRYSWGLRYTNGKQPEWCYHFSSQEPLERWQRAALETAAKASNG